MEGVSKKDPGQLVGHTRTFKRVVFDGNARLIGSRVNVTITGGNGHTLMGDVVTREASFA